MIDNLQDFIAVYEKAYTQDFCDRCIAAFKSAEDSGFTYTRQQQDGVRKTDKDDSAMFVMADTTFNFVHTRELANDFISTFWSSLFPIYVNKYSAIEDFPPLSVFELKLQKTNVGGGYHVWHCEDASRQLCNRVLSFILYLNDVDDGGETEFLYYPRRVKPTAGTLLLFPAGFTHTHRGNPPLSGTKYVIAGWVEL